MDYIITQCPTDTCNECCQFYSNSLINCKMICKCECHNIKSEIKRLKEKFDAALQELTQKFSQILSLIESLAGSVNRTTANVVRNC